MEDKWFNFKLGFLIFGTSVAIIVIILSIIRPDLFDNPESNKNLYNNEK